MNALLSRVALAGSAAALLATSSPAAAADNSALLEILVRKGVLTRAEAASVQQEAAKEEQVRAKETAAIETASKIKLSSSISELRLYGDTRLRYQYDNKDFQVDPFDGSGDFDRSPSGSQRSRFRFRLRLNADFKLGPSWFGGVELQTGLASDSANQTFEDGYSDYPIFISRAYLGYKYADWLKLTGGKAPNPFYTTELVWDPDINPVGIFEEISLTKLFGHKAEVAADGKSVAAKDVIPMAKNPWDITLVAGQMLFDDNLESNFDNDDATDAFAFETQLIATYNFNDTTRLTLAPGWLVYNAASTGYSAAKADVFGNMNENAFLGTAAQRNLNIVLLPGDLSFNLGKVRTKFYWDVAYNLEGRQRYEEVYGIVRQINQLEGDPDDFASDVKWQDSLAWLVGLQLGENRKAGDWSLLANYRETGVAAVDPNINESDFAQGELNTRGVKLSLAYNLSDFAVLGLTYMFAWNLDDNLTGGQATGGNAIADSNSIQILQVDLNVKF